MSAILVKSYVGQAERYFERELTNEREISYSEADTAAGQWTGAGAEALGLKGSIEKADFSQMSRGINPATGKRFRRMTLSRTREINGKLTEVKEIAGWDLLISAPKSVSIVALLGQDERVRAAHEEAVTSALIRAERQAQANNGGSKKEQTGNLVIARFRHDSARPAYRDGFVAPQLHDHCFVMNATRRADGVWKPLESVELHRAQSYVRSVYYTELADRLQKIGYAVEIDAETGAPEIKEISQEYRRACAPRRAEILELAEKAGKNYRQLGLVNRREKVYDKNLIREQHEGMEGFFNYQAKRAAETARTVPPSPPEEEQHTAQQTAAKEAVTFALTRVAERRTIFDPRQVLLEAHRRGIGKATVALMEAEFERCKRDGKVETVQLRDGRTAAFLSAEKKEKSELPSRNKITEPQKTLSDELIDFQSAAFSSGVAVFNAGFRQLPIDQQAAVKEILSARASVKQMRGRVGVTQTDALEVVGIAAAKANYEVLALTPATGTAQKSDRVQMTGATLQKLLSEKEPSREQKRFYIIDESAFVSLRQMDKFFREAIKSGDRVLLTGEAHRLENAEKVEGNRGIEQTRVEKIEKVEKGKEPKNAVSDIEHAALAASVEIEANRRQPTKKAVRQAIKNLPVEQFNESVNNWLRHEQIREKSNREERHAAIVVAFVGEPRTTIVVTSEDTDRQTINRKIRTALKAAGEIGREETEIEILRPRGISGTERAFAVAYRENDVISYARGSAEHKIAAQSLARVVKINREDNLLSVEIQDSGNDRNDRNRDSDADNQNGREITYNPKRLRGVSVWTQEQIKVSVGDRIQFRASYAVKKTKIAAGAIYEVAKITPDALTLKADKGETVKLDAKQTRAMDYGYAAALDNLRNKTLDRVLVHAETAESKANLIDKIAPLIISQPLSKTLIFTDNAVKLVGKLTGRVERVADAEAKLEMGSQAATRTSEIIVEPKPISENKRREIRPLEKTPTVEKMPVTEVHQQLLTAKTDDIAADATNRQKIMIEEVLQWSRESLADGDQKPSAKAWQRYEVDVIRDAPRQRASLTQIYPLIGMQKNQPESERVKLEGISRLEATHLLLKLSPENIRWELVIGRLETYERQIKTESVEVKPEAVKLPVKLPGIVPVVEQSLTPKFAVQPLSAKTVSAGEEAKNNREILIGEVLQISRITLARHGTEPSAEAWRRFAKVVADDLPNEKSGKEQEKLLQSLQKDVLLTERVSAEGKSSLVAVHAILKLAPDDRRADLVTAALEIYEKQIVAERAATLSEQKVDATNIKIVEAAQILSVQSGAGQTGEIVQKSIYRGLDDSDRAAQVIPTSAIGKVPLPTAKEGGDQRSSTEMQPVERPVAAINADVRNALNEEKIRLIKGKYTAQTQFHHHEVAESRAKDFEQIHVEASQYAGFIATKQKEQHKSLPIDAVSKTWKSVYEEDYQARWDDNRTRRVERRANEIREAIAINARFSNALRAENLENKIIRRANLAKIESAPVENKTVAVMRNVREAHQNWKEVKDPNVTPQIESRTERVIQFSIERDAAAAPNQKTVETANDIARANRLESPQFRSELDAKIWVMTNLPETGKQLFLENYIERIEQNTATRLVEMQTIQINESFQLLRQQSEKMNQELNNAELDRMWRNLQQSVNVPVTAAESQTVAQFQTDAGRQEIAAPISVLDAIHTTLTKTSEEIRETKMKMLISVSQSEVKEDEMKIKAQSRMQSDEETISRSQVLRM